MAPRAPAAAVLQHTSPPASCWRSEAWRGQAGHGASSSEDSGTSCTRSACRAAGAGTTVMRLAGARNARTTGSTALNAAGGARLRAVPARCHVAWSTARAKRPLFYATTGAAASCCACCLLHGKVPVRMRSARSHIASAAAQLAAGAPSQCHCRAQHSPWAMHAHQAQRRW